MKVIWLFSRIARRSRTGDFTKLSMIEQEDLMEAANGALMQTYNALPAYFKEITEGFELPAPQSITLAVVHGSNELSSSVFTDAQIGRSVLLDGDPNWNQVISTDRLLNPYMGLTGVASGTLYGDAVYSTRYPFDRIIGNPTFANRSSASYTYRELVKVNNSSDMWPQQNVGQPMGWWVQMLGNSQGNEPLMVLRFSPAPNQAYVVDVRLAFWSKRLTLQDYTDNATLPVPDQFLETVLLPLALRNFMSSPAWKSGPGDKDVIDRAADATLFAKNQVGQPAAPLNLVGTPTGF